MKRWIGLLILWNALFILPLAALILAALAARWSFPDVVPQIFNGRGIRFLFENGRGIARALTSSTLYSALVIPATVAVTILPASVLARYEFRGRVALEALLISPVLIPAIAYALGLQGVMIRAGLSDTMAGVVIVLTTASYPYMLRALIAGYQNINPDLVRCAENLGASPARALLLVIAPLLIPAVVAGGSIVFLVAFSDYFLVFLIGGGAVNSFTGYLFPYLTAGDRAVSSALTLVFLIVPIVLFLGIDRSVERFYRRRGIG